MSSLLIGFVMLYLVFHALNGNHGVYALLKEQKRESFNTVILADLQAQRAKIEHRVSMISGEMLDLDLLDEQARRVLGFTDPQELIYLLPVEG
ncbi:MAG: septum formation initiator family protein [Rickettsiales bacterium]|nr:septum formation initiator family protein [Rickettsiales bacterium]